MIAPAPLLRIDHLTVSFPSDDGELRAVSDASLALNRGEILCLVGESGCGKSTLAFALVGLLPKNAKVAKEASVLFDGSDLLRVSSEDLRRVRGKRISMIFQDPMTTLNPVENVRKHMLEMLEAHGLRNREETTRLKMVMESVRLDYDRAKEFPHQLSGGMRQRVMIALSLLLNPELIIADEPTTSLDVLVEAQILDIFNSLKSKRHLSILFITHNFGVVAQIADRVAVMYGGEIVEVGEVRSIFKNPMHPYTQALMKCVPNIADYRRKIEPLPGSPLKVESRIGGDKETPACIFRARCPFAFERCFTEKPKMIGGDHMVACHVWDKKNS